MKLSVIVPAWNEERLLPGCLAALRGALGAAVPPPRAEIIVVDNNSADRTAELALAAGARVVFEPVNQIARARNAGAAAASGDWLMFVDADSMVSAGLVADVLTLIATGQAVGCGSVLRMAGLPAWARASLGTWNGLSRCCGWAAGSLLVCRADAFRAVGGFSEALYAAEEIDLSRRLKRWGRARGLRFPILARHPLQTSPRKLELYSGRELAAQMARLLLRPWTALRDRRQLGLWYDGRR